MPSDMLLIPVNTSTGEIAMATAITGKDTENRHPPPVCEFSRAGYTPYLKQVQGLFYFSPVFKNAYWQN
jgi:hypothetical protein